MASPLRLLYQAGTWWGQGPVSSPPPPTTAGGSAHRRSACVPKCSAEQAIRQWCRVVIGRREWACSRFANSFGVAPCPMHRAHRCIGVCSSSRAALRTARACSSTIAMAAALQPGLTGLPDAHAHPQGAWQGSGLGWGPVGSARQRAPCTQLVLHACAHADDADLAAAMCSISACACAVMGVREDDWDAVLRLQALAPSKVGHLAGTSVPASQRWHKRWAHTGRARARPQVIPCFGVHPWCVAWQHAGQCHVWEGSSCALHPQAQPASMQQCLQQCHAARPLRPPSPPQHPPHGVRARRFAHLHASSFTPEGQVRPAGWLARMCKGQRARAHGP